VALNDDAPIDEIREIRHRMSAQFGHDTKRLVEYIMELQKQREDRLLHTAKTLGPNVDKTAMAS
jgi:hypothetical protein